MVRHVDAGKSTLSGNILYLMGAVDKRTIEKYEKEAKERNRESWFLAFIMDTNEEERAKGKTVEVGRAHFATENKRFTVLDAPGHKNYVPAMISGAAQARSTTTPTLSLRGTHAHTLCFAQVGARCIGRHNSYGIRPPRIHSFLAQVCAKSAVLFCSCFFAVARQADVGVLVISARKGEFEAGFDRQGQTREHAMLAKTLGVKQLIVVVNKMDSAVDDDYPKARRRACRMPAETKTLLFRIGTRCFALRKHSYGFPDSRIAHSCCADALRQCAYYYYY